MVKTLNFQINTNGNCDIIDITPEVSAGLSNCNTNSGVAVLFVVGSTAAITTVEYEPGLVEHDISAALEKIAPADGYYEHEKTWHDDNGHAHVRASLIGPSLTVPIVDGQLALGTWQQIILVDFDTRCRKRKVICQLIS